MRKALVVVGVGVGIGLVAISLVGVTAYVLEELSKELAEGHEPEHASSFGGVGLY